MRTPPEPRSTIPRSFAAPAAAPAIALFVLGASCSSSPLQGQPDCTGIPITAIACLVGPTVNTCSRDANGRPVWITTCPGENDGGSDGGGDGGGDIGDPCASTASCASGEICTTADGVCNAPPGCGGDAAACPAVCYGTCRVPNEDGTGPACGPVQCAKGMVCCNSSCGTCTAPGGGCTAIFCTTPTAPCNVDGDCRLEADYCTGCDCRVLGTGQTVPTCSGPGVNCLVDPCGNKSVRCVNGACVSQ